MACCLALALVIGVLRAGWFRAVRGVEPPRAGFAPPARRPGPGPVSVPVPPDPGPRPPDPAPRAPVSRHRSAVEVMSAALLGAGGYAALLALLVAGGAVVADDRPLRTAGLIAAAMTAAAVRVRRRPRPPAGWARLSGPAGWAPELAVGGAAWSGLSVLDMHVTGLVPEHLVGRAADVALHGPGFLALAVGGAALLAGPRYLSVLSPGGAR